MCNMWGGAANDSAPKHYGASVGSTDGGGSRMISGRSGFGRIFRETHGTGVGHDQADADGRRGGDDGVRGGFGGDGGRKGERGGRAASVQGQGHRREGRGPGAV